MNWAPVGLILVGLIWSGGFAWAHFRAVGKAKAAETWPTAMGKVLGSVLNTDNGRDGVDLRPGQGARKERC